MEQTFSQIYLFTVSMNRSNSVCYLFTYGRKMTFGESTRPRTPINNNKTTCFRQLNFVSLLYLSDKNIRYHDFIVESQLQRMDSVILICGTLMF